jgi:two-component system response regulator MprA
MKGEVLIVEDDREIRASIVELLEDEGYRVAVAESGAVALESLRGAVTLPGLLLLDLMMPDMDGFQFRAEQLKDERLAPIPVVLMTAGFDLAAKAKQLQVQGYLRKPFPDLDAILEMIRRFF